MPVPVLPNVGGAPGPAPPPPTVAERTPSLELRATWRPERYARVANGGFEEDAEGWSVGPGINAAGDSIAREEGAGVVGAAGLLVTAAEPGSGAHYDLAGQRFLSDAGHSTLFKASLWLRHVEGGRRVAITLGSAGDASARASVEVELAHEWQEHALLWRPQADVTDAQLAIATADGQAVTCLVDGVALWSPLASQVDNGSFLTGTTGWSVAGTGLAAAAASLARVAADGIAGACAQLVTDDEAGSGAGIELPGVLFRADMTHRLRVALRRLSGPGTVEVRLGTAGDHATAEVPVTGTWSWHVLDWTPQADRTGVGLAVVASGDEATTVRIAEAEVYEALDELAFAAWDVTRGASFDGSAEPSGQAGGSLPDVEDRYAPWNEASPLHGSVVEGVAVMARATHDGRARGLGWGRIAAIAPDPYGRTAHLTTGDGLAELAGRIDLPFRSDRSFAAARDEALTLAGAGAWQRDLDAAGPESMTLFDGTDGPVPALSYLAALNAATGTVHVAEPSPRANVAWVYRTVNRARLTDASVQWVIDDDSRGPLPGMETRAESLVTVARTTWQGHELVRTGLTNAIELPWGSGPAPLPGASVLAVGGDPLAWPTLRPYMTVTSDDIGADAAAEPEVVVATRRRTRYRRRKRRWRLVRKEVRTRIVRWDDPAFPVVVAEGESRDIAVDLSVPVEGMEARPHPVDADVSLEARPGRAVVTVRGPATLTGLALVGRAWLPSDEEEVVSRSPRAEVGAREPSQVGGAYVGGPGQAEGITGHLVWRYESARLRPVVRDALQPARMLGIRVGDHVRMGQSKYKLPPARFVVRSVAHEVRRPDAIDWHASYVLEALPPDAGPWVLVDGGAAAGIDGGARMAP